MNPQLDTNEARPDGPASHAQPYAATRPMYWSIRRELWENRFLYIAPMIITVVVLFGSLASLAINLATRLRELQATGGVEPSAMTLPFRMSPAPIMLSTFIVGMLYCLDALNGERRDRSILFWKSLPVSDRTTVLAKMTIPLLFMPLLGFVLSVIAQLILLPAGSVVVAAAGMNPLRLWQEVRFFEGLPIMLYGLLVHALWFSPIFGWFLLISASVRRAAILWAVLPLLAVSALERFTSGTSYFVLLLKHRITGAMKAAFALEPGDGGSVDRLSQLTPLRFLTTPGLWLGLLFAVICVSAAVRLRRYREPI